MKVVLKVVGGLLLLLVLAAGGVYAWASNSAGNMLSRDVAVHEVDFPIPFPLDSAEIAELGLTPEQADSAATARALERATHLVDARYGCKECHGQDFSGGVMVDAFPLGTLLGPNLTGGSGSRTVSYTAADWDAIVRHGVRADGRPAMMPSQDFLRMSDRELSDIVAYIRAQPPVDNQVPEPTLGPLGKVLAATGELPLSYDLIDDHALAHETEPPAAGPTAEFGMHLTGVCVGCHHEDFAGGPIVGGDPSWGPAANITPHADGLAGWTLDQFVAVLRDGKRPDGTDVQMPMTLVQPFAQRMTDVELEAMFVYLQSIPALPDRS